MNKLLAIIIIIMFLAYVPLGPVNYSSELSGIFIFLGNIQNILASSISMIITHIISLSMLVIDNILPLIATLYNIVLSLPYEEINYWYVLLGFIVVSFFAEKFRTINNEINKLNKKISKSNHNQNPDNTESSISEIKILSKKAESILNLLSEINTAAESFKNSGIRSKKSRRASSEIIESDNSITTTSLAKDEDQLMRLRKDQSLQENNSDVIMNDDNISQIDLARAFIETNERESAIDLIKKIIDTGTEEEKHEAKLLYMQIK